MPLKAILILIDEVTVKNISVQLYSLRELLATDYEGTIRKIPGLGYNGIETFGAATPPGCGKLFKELGLRVVSSHSPMPLGERQNELIDAVLAAGSPIYIVPGVRPEEIASVDSTKRFCDQLNEAALACQARGLAFGFHNHYREMYDVGGVRVYQVMNAQLAPGVLFEVDTYWAKSGGVDPAEVIRELGARVTHLHVKDGPGGHGAPQTTLGTGIMDIPAVLAAAPQAEAIVEFDSCAGDLLESLRLSAGYLKEK